MSTKNSWYVDKNKIRTDYIRIQNLSQWIMDKVPYLHPSHPDYIKFWSRESKRCIEGKWGKEFGKYRYMPGNLYFFGNYGIIEHSWKDDRGVKVTEDIKPFIVDFIWEYAYQSWVSRGFSGFEKDEEYSCNRMIESCLEGKCSTYDLSPFCFTPSGEVKKFQEPMVYLSRLHPRNLGKALFENSTVGNLTFGSRGSSKSYWSAIGEVEYNFVFGGAQRFDEKFINNESKCDQCIGSSEVAKSAEMLQKFEYSQKCKTDTTKEKFKDWFGIWVETDARGNKDVIPCPFYKHYVGSLECPNKENKYTAVLKMKVNGKWTETGVGSCVTHVNYSDKKANGERAAEGGRYIYSNLEEIGSSSNAVGIWGANEGTLTRGGVRIGFQSGQGTSGNLLYVQAAKRLFLNPRDYNILAYRNIFSTEGTNHETALFIPYYITLFQYKDKNGNTDYDKAIAHVNEERLELSKSSDPRVLRDFLMNKPCYVPEMWSSLSGYYLPYEEATERERELMHGQMYKNLGKNVELVWEKDGSVKYNILHNAEPIDTFPIPKDIKDPSGCVVIYEFPVENAPPDLYSYSCDTYVEENIEDGGSLAVTYVFKSPKYIVKGITGNIIVASYIGKPSKGLAFYYEQQEKLIALYGNAKQALWYDARGGGETLREYYITRGKQYLLCLRPQNVKGDSIYQKRIVSHGVVVGNRESKKTLLKMAYDWLLQETEFPDETILRNIFRIPCKFLISQIASYNLEDNFDAVSSLLFIILGLKETESREERVAQNRNEVNLFAHLLKNKNIFKEDAWSYKDADLVPNPK